MFQLCNFLTGQDWLFLSLSLCDYCLKEKRTKKIAPEMMGNGLRFTLKSVDVDAQLGIQNAPSQAPQTPIQFAGKMRDDT